MSWCTGVHDDDGLCDRSGNLWLGEETQWSILASPCSDGAVSAWLAEAWFYQTEDFDTAIAHLARMRDDFASSMTEADCDQHYHPEEDE